MKIWIVSRKKLGVLACCAAGLIVLAVALGTGLRRAVPASAQARKIPIYCVEKQEKVISISFDAAWGNEDTQRLIDELGQYNVKATFFVVGQWVDKYPESVKALADAGHEIMNHSNTHPHMPQLSAAQMTDEINACNDKIEAVTGVRPLLLRPPYGDYNNALVETLHGLGMYCIQWDVDSLDWKGISASQIYSRVTSRVKNGSIVLFHNAAAHTPEALPMILEELVHRQGYSIVPISQLIYRDSYLGDHEGRQHPQTGSASAAAPSA